MGHPLVHVIGHAVCVCVWEWGCVGVWVGVWVCGGVGGWVGVNGMCEGYYVNIKISSCCDDSKNGTIGDQPPHNLCPTVR